jgi:hypothetical protein
VTTRARRQQPDIEPRARPSAARTRYKPSVRSRTARDELRTPLRPDFQRELSDTIRLGIEVEAPGTNKIGPLSIAADDTKIRLIKFTVVNHTSDGARNVEIFFDDGNRTNIFDTLAWFTNVDILQVPDGGAASTQTWARGTGPVGALNSGLSWRFQTAPTTNTYFVFLEFTTER